MRLEKKNSGNMSEEVGESKYIILRRRFVTRYPKIQKLVTVLYIFGGSTKRTEMAPRIMCFELSFQGTVSRNFRPSVFFIKTSVLGP
jgi:hypothetical protein